MRPAVTDLPSQLGAWLAKGVAAVAPERAAMPIIVERPKQAAHGDYATNVALQHAKAHEAQSARIRAGARRRACRPRRSWPKTEIAGAGFINLFVTPAARPAIVARILAERERFGRRTRAQASA